MFLSIESLKKSYSGRTVLDIQHAEIEKGAVTVLIGPSGAGKSTLLSIINGIERLDEGKLVFEGEEFSRQKPVSLAVARKMAFVFQNPALFSMTVFDNIAYGLKIRKVSHAEIKTRVEQIAEWTGLSSLLKQKAATLSGGEAGRVSLARAMVIKPELLLMDEPTANLDPKNVAAIEEMIVKARDEFGTTVFLVTHNMFQAKRLGERVMLLLDGKIAESQPASGFFENTQSKEAQEFITGKMIY